MGFFENLELWVVFQFQKVKQLQPKILQLVCIVLKELKIVADCGQNFIELGLKIFVVFSHYDFVYGLFSLAVHIRTHRIFLLVNYNQTVFFCIFLQLIFDGPNNTVDFLTKQLK